MNNQLYSGLIKWTLTPFIILIFTFLFYGSADAQEQPPKPIAVTVSTTQQLSFGSFIQAGSNGTVSVDAYGVRSATGSIILPNISSIITPALFEVHALPGTLINIMNGPDAILSGSNMGTMILHLDNSNPRSPFITTGAITWITIGGTLTVGSIFANPAGDYSGTFSVTFIQE